MIKTIFFDIGGVYTKEKRSYLVEKIATDLCLNEEAVKLSVRKFMMDFSEGRTSEKKFFELLAVDMNTSADKLKRLWYLKKDFEINLDVDKIVRKLKENGYTVAAITDIDPVRLNEHKKRGTYEVFDFCLNSVESKSLKENRVIFLQALKRVKVSAGDCVMIDDSEKKLAVARDIGMKTILFENEIQLKKDLRNLRINL